MDLPIRLSVFNKDGKIVSWQFTKSGSFKEVKSVLEAVVHRSTMQEDAVKTVYVDNCCQWRNKLQSPNMQGQA